MKLFSVQRHVNVGRKNADQEGDQTPTGRAPDGREQQPQTTRDFSDAAQQYEQLGRGQERRYDLPIQIRFQKMQYASHDKKDDREQTQDSLQPFHILDLSWSSMG